jgi:enoyl-CoA hydratase
MEHVKITHTPPVALVTLSRGKVNALNDAVIEELSRGFEEIQADSNVRAVILTGEGRFFSFGFDIPGFLPYSKEEFTRYLEKFTGLYTSLYLHPKPVVAALNGHAIAGGCMLASACDRRVMASGHAKISLNEVTFGASVFAGSVEMLRACVGSRNAERMLYSGAMYTAEEAAELGLVDRVTSPEHLMEAAMEEARGLAWDGPAFRSLKGLLRGPIADRMRQREADSIREFVDIWYSAPTREKLKKIEIRR